MQPDANDRSSISAVFHALQALADGERHAYGIAKEVARRTEGKVGPEFGRIQAMLEMELIEESDRRPDLELDRSRRSYYRLTSLGRRLLAAEVERLAAAAEQKNAEPGQKKLENVLALDQKYADAYNDELAVIADATYKGNKLAELWLHVRRYDEADSALRTDIEAYPDAPRPILNLGILLNSLGRHADAVEALSKLLRLRPHWLSSHVYLGVALAESGQPVEAQTHLEHAIGSVGRVQALTYLYLGKLHAQRGDAVKAAAAWKIFLEKDSDSASARRVRELLNELDGSS